MDNIPWYKRGAISTSNPFSTFGTDYCQRCKMECEADMYCLHVGETFTYKKVCCRCGKVICRGMWDHVKAITQRPLPAAAFEWCLEDGKDRR